MIQQLTTNNELLAGLTGHAPVHREKVITPEMQDEWQKRIQQANFRLRMFAYVLYEKLQSLTFDVKNKLVEAGIYEEPLPKRKHRAKGQKHGARYNKEVSYNTDKALENIKRLVMNCGTDERATVLRWGFAPMPLYRQAFCDEGCVYTLLSQTMVDEILAEGDQYLKVSIMTAVANMDKLPEENKESMRAVMHLKSYNYMYREMRKFVIETLNDIPIRKENLPTLSQSYKDFDVNVERIYQGVIQDKDNFKERYGEGVAKCISNLVRKINSEEVHQGYVDSLEETFRSYANYCVANWLVKAKNNVPLDDDYKYLRENFGFSDADLKKLTDELVKSTIDTSVDVYDIKDFIPLMQTPMVNKFIETFITL